MNRASWISWRITVMVKRIVWMDYTHIVRTLWSTPQQWRASFFTFIHRSVQHSVQHGKGTHEHDSLISQNLLCQDRCLWVKDVAGGWWYVEAMTGMHALLFTRAEKHMLLSGQCTRFYIGMCFNGLKLLRTTCETEAKYPTMDRSGSIAWCLSN